MDQTPPAPPGPSPHIHPGAGRHVVREPDDRKIAGVCSGLADYMGIDVTVMRVSAVVLALVTPVALIAYLVAAVAVPERRPDQPRVQARRVHLGSVPHPVLVVGAIVAVAALIDDAWWLEPFPAAVALVGVGVWLLVEGRDDEETPPTPPPSRGAPWPPEPGDPPRGSEPPSDAPTTGPFAAGPADTTTDPAATAPEEAITEAFVAGPAATITDPSSLAPTDRSAQPSATAPAGTTTGPLAGGPADSTAEPLAAGPADTTAQPFAAGPADTTTEPFAAPPAGATTEPVAAGPADTTTGVSEGRDGATLVHPMAASPWVVSVWQHSNAEGDGDTTLTKSDVSPGPSAPPETGTGAGSPGEIPPPASPWWSGRPADPPVSPSAPTRRRRHPSLATPVASLLLVGAGVLWLLASLDVVSVSGTDGLALGLVAVGVALVVASWRGRAYALVPIAAVLMGLLILAETLDVPLDAGTGNRTVFVDSAAELAEHHEVFAGRLTVDLTDAPLARSRTNRLEASVGMGELRVIVPADAQVEGTASSDAGQVVFPGQRDIDQSGISVDESFALEGDGPRVELDLSVGFGTVEVIRG